MWSVLTFVSTEMHLIVPQVYAVVSPLGPPATTNRSTILSSTLFALSDSTCPAMVSNLLLLLGK